jgi:hypothetical protein
MFRRTKIVDPHGTMGGSAPRARAQAKPDLRSGLTAKAAARTYGLTPQAAREFVDLVDQAHEAYWSANDAACERARQKAGDFLDDPKNWA